MVKTAFLFPGQGSQFVGMGQNFFEADPGCRALFEEANDILGDNLTELCFQGPEEKLKLTENTQPALLTHSIIALKRLRDHGIESVLTAGHSLGEFSALVCAGSLRFGDAVHLVRQRGRFMQEAVPVGVGAMAAIIGLSAEQVQQLCRNASSEESIVQPANLNSPEQIVIAGHKASVEAVSEQARDQGAKKVVILPVSAPFHCQLMEPAAVRLQAEMEKIDFKELDIPVVTNADARLNTSGGQARESLVRQVCSPVRWTETMQVIVDQGIEAIVEVGSGKVLSGLMKRFNKDIRCYQVGDEESLAKTVAELK
ncbi:ACP S-malonyltransferase [Nitrospina watsonii]|uniref:Malonyl CoA-acyl carrier protein transacylase n=1 Tax=Nitrospina watsonii TaxID=1323948 RepID=A0ABM9HDJ5_9BACT|nr:ACP S-malonyltransferase [Nitrospina watsonii]CAI2718256.1 [acyl-carrier-protein] S-malonyltransferase [Nitrospina watsonii]